VLARRIAFADATDAIAAPRHGETVDRHVVGMLEVEAATAAGIAAVDGDAERSVHVALAVKDDGCVVGAAIGLRQLVAPSIGAPGEDDARARMGSRDRRRHSRGGCGRPAVAGASRAYEYGCRGSPRGVRIVAIEALHETHVLAATRDDGPL
jgi:hypothetical protein